MAKRTTITPTQERAVHTRQQILDHAERLLARGRPSTTNHIARAAGVNVATVYRYFQNKEAIADELAVRLTERLRASVEEELDQVRNLPFIVGAPRLGAAVVESLITERQLFAGSLDLPSDARARRRRDRIDHQIVGYVRDYLVSCPDLALDDPDLVATVTANAFLSVAQRAVRASPPGRDRLVGAALGMVVTWVHQGAPIHAEAPSPPT